MSQNNCSIDNIYQLNGRVPVGVAIPFGLQHILAMFVSNITPIILVAAVAKLNGAPMSEELTATLIQNCMFVAGIASLIQIVGIWKIGSHLPIIMGISFTFLAVMMTAATKDYNIAMGGVIAGGCIEGLLGLTYKYWKGIISPIVSACVVVGIGLSLFTVGTNSFGGGGTYMEDFGAAKYWIVGSTTLIVCIIWRFAVSGPLRSLNALFGLIVGYIVSIPFGMVDFSTVTKGAIIGFPKILPTGMPIFDVGTIISFTVIFLVSATETIGDTSALCESGLHRPVTVEETTGSLGCDGFASAIAGIFGCSPITSFSQNVGLCALTKVVNRFTVGTGVAILILCGFLPPLARIFQTIPQPVLGGCTIMMFGQIMVSGMQMIVRAGFTPRNMCITALSIIIGGGFTQSNQIFQFAPQIIQDIFATNVVAIIFVIAVVLNLVLPKREEDIKIEKEFELAVHKAEAEMQNQ